MPDAVWTAALTRVAVAEIPLALAQRWKTIVADHPSAGSRSSSMNLITFADDPAAGPAVSSVVGELAAAHPVRAVTVIDDESTPEDSVDSYVRGACIMCDGNRPAGSEEVFLRANPRAAERVASAVYGLLTADMPVYLWWRGPSPYGSALFKLVAPFADKIIVDSMRFGDTSAGLDTVRRLAARRPGHVAVADLNWKRARPWRLLLAACFDDPALLAMLGVFDRCEITFAYDGADPTPPSARAALLAGWVTSRVPRLRGRTRIAPLRVSEPGAGRIEGVTVAASHSKPLLRLARKQEPLGIEAHAFDQGGSAFRQWNFPAQTLSEAELLHDCLDDPSRDPIFEAALTQE